VLSFNDFALTHFADYSLNIVELASKILDFYNKEKIVRIICRLFDRLKDDKECLDHLGMVNALNIMLKL